MSPLNEIVAQAMTNITGMAVDITTVAVGAIVIFVLILGADLLRVTILGGASRNHSGMTADKYIKSHSKGDGSFREGLRPWEEDQITRWKRRLYDD